MAKPESPNQDTLEIERPAFAGPRIPIALNDAAGKIVAHLIRTEADHRLVRVKDFWVLVDVTKVKPADIDALGRKYGVLDECEVIV